MYNNIFNYKEISFIVDCDDFDEFIDSDWDILILLDGVRIGCISLQVYPPEIHIESFGIDTIFQRRGYGTMVIEGLKELAKQYNVTTIEGESRSGLYEFYTNLGAVYENRTSDDEELILNKFYIDL